LCGVGASVSGCSVTTPYASSFAYNAPGQLTGFTFGNGVTASTLQYVAGLFPSLSPSGGGGGGGGGGRTCFTSRVQTAVPDASPTGTSQNQGGHNEINFTAPASALGPIQSNAFSIAGVNNGYRIGGLIYSLHINNVTALTPTTIGFQAHEDVFNPASGLVGLIGHTVVDLAIGTVFFHHSSNLDGKC
jgi:hypothetical protein